jgi:hypothetical protein
MGNILDFVLALFTARAEADEEKSGGVAADVVSWVFSMVLAILFLIWLGSGGGGPLAVGLKLAIAISMVVKVGSILVVLILAWSAVYHPADNLIRKGGRLVLFLAIVVFWFSQSTDSRPSRKQAASRPTSASARQSVEPTQYPVVQARIDEAERQKLAARVTDLRAQTRTRWRADMEAAGATGAPGVVPPMLEVYDQGRGVWRVTNRHSQWVLVRLSRVAPPEGASVAWRRCVLDESSPFLEIPAGGTRRFVLEAGCAGSLLEFRVGEQMRPDLPWWTSTALEEFDRGTSRIDSGHEHWNAARLTAEISSLENTLANTDRAARWRRELSRYDTRVEAE